MFVRYTTIIAQKSFFLQPIIINHNIAKSQRPNTQIIGHTRASTGAQDPEKQRHLLPEYTQRHPLHIGEFFNVEVPSRKETRERRGAVLLTKAGLGCGTSFGQEAGPATGEPQSGAGVDDSHHQGNSAARFPPLT